MRRRGAIVAAAAGATALASSGCHWFASWLLAPRHPKQTIKAEYRLEAERLVIVLYAGTDILFSFPTAPLEISRDLVNQIIQNLKGRVKEIVHPVEVLKWQESNLEWPNTSLEDIAKHFRSDTLLYVELEQYTMVEERSANLLRGRIAARLQVVKTDATHNPVYEAHVEVRCPEDSPVGVLDISELQIRARTSFLFAQAVVRKFHDHEVEVKGGKP